MAFDGEFDDATHGAIDLEPPEAGVGSAELADGDLEPPDPAIAGMPVHLSPSSASTFTQCARRWQLRYLERLPDPPGEPALAGTFAHRVLEALFQEPPEARTVERAKELARAVWPETAADPDFVALGLDEAAERAFRWRGWLAVEGLWPLEDPAQVQVEATEQDVRVDLGGVPFRGIIDRLERAPDGLTVTDYKSGRAPSARHAPGRLHQVMLYAAAVGAQHGERPVRARLLYLGQQVLEAPVTDDAHDAAVETLAATWAAMETACTTDEFAPSPGPLCAWCPFVASCAEGTAEVELRHLAGRVRADAPALGLLAAAS